MPRTEEQVAADEALTAAIERALLARGYLDAGEITLEYVLCIATQKWGDDGEPDNSFCTLYREGSVSSTRVLGLLEAAKMTLRADMRD